MLRVGIGDSRQFSWLLAGALPIMLVNCGKSVLHLKNLVPSICSPALLPHPVTTPDWCFLSNGFSQLSASLQWTLSEVSTFEPAKLAFIRKARMPRPSSSSARSFPLLPTLPLWTVRISYVATLKNQEKIEYWTKLDMWAEVYSQNWILHQMWSMEKK